MREKLIQYVDLLFEGSNCTEDIKQEILQNTLDRYDDLVSHGKTPQAAYQLSISGIGDINEIMENQPEPKTNFSAAAQPESSHLMDDDLQKAKQKKKLFRAIAIALFILSAIPILILENSIGVCACLGIIAVGVAILIANGKEEDDAPADISTTASVKHGRSAINRAITGIIWIIGLCAYFLLSFGTGAWYITWVIFPILGSICGFIDACFDLPRKPVGAIIRIVVFLLLILLMVSVALGLLFGFSNFSSVFSSEISGEYNTSNGSVNAMEIQNIQIEWVAGSITIQTGDTDEITFTESYYGDDAKPMVWKQSDSKLILQYCESGFNFSFGINSTFSVPSKDLVITVPREWKCTDLIIDSVSAKIMVSDLVCDTIDLNNVSGECTFEKCNVDELNLETVSGEITYSGGLNSMDCDSVSADCEIITSSHPSSIDMDGVSCDLILHLPESCGFSVDMDTSSGDFNSDFATTSKNGKHVYGDGHCEINADSASGNIEIRKYSE